MIHEVGLHCVSRPRREPLRRARRTEPATAMAMHALTAAPTDEA
ncbi:hypothetical protein [Kallotenue papyrolyticum]|nr:hypothetical protein [Kallotenue papyrolyticum]